MYTPGKDITQGDSVLCTKMHFKVFVNKLGFAIQDIFGFVLLSYFDSFRFITAKKKIRKNICDILVEP